jgi:hypothetical protein
VEVQVSVLVDEEEEDAVRFDLQREVVLVLYLLPPLSHPV